MTSQQQSQPLSSQFNELPTAPSDQEPILTEEAKSRAETSTVQAEQENPTVPTEEQPLDEALLDQMLQQKFGTTLEQAQQMYDEQQQNQAVQASVQQLMEIWDVDESGVQERAGLIMEQFSDILESRPEFDSVDGYTVLYGAYQKGLEAANVKTQPKAPLMAQQSRFTRTTQSKAAPLFTRQQIDGMTPQERQQNHSQILAAFANGRVQ